MRNGLVLPRVTFWPTHRIACILHSVQDKEGGLLGKMIKSHRWPNLSRGWRTPSWTTELLHLNIHVASPLDRFTVLEKKSTIQKRFEEGKKFEIQKEIQNSWGVTQGLRDRYNHTPSGPACLGPIRNMFSPVGTPVFHDLPQSKSAKSESPCVPPRETLCLRPPPPSPGRWVNLYDVLRYRCKTSQFMKSHHEGRRI